MTAAAETPPRTCGGLCPGRLRRGAGAFGRGGGFGGGFRAGQVLRAGQGLRRGRGFGRGRLRAGRGLRRGNPNGAEHLFPMRAAASPGGGPQACPAGCARTQRAKRRRNPASVPRRLRPNTTRKTTAESCKRAPQAAPERKRANRLQTKQLRAKRQRKPATCPAGCTRTQTRKTTTDEATARETAAEARNVPRRLRPNTSAQNDYRRSSCARNGGESPQRAPQAVPERKRKTAVSKRRRNSASGTRQGPYKEPAGTQRGTKDTSGAP